MYHASRLLRSGRLLLLTVPRAKLAIGQRAFSYSSPVSGMPSHYPSEMLRPLAHSIVASNHSVLTHSSRKLNIRHPATDRASVSSHMLDYVARYTFSCVCVYVCRVVCYYCKKPGHIMAMCHKRLAKLSGVANQQSNNEGNQGNPAQHDNCVY